jgi:hypothetical protein
LDCWPRSWSRSRAAVTRNGVVRHFFAVEKHVLSLCEMK